MRNSMRSAGILPAYSRLAASLAETLSATVSAAEAAETVALRTLRLLLKAATQHARLPMGGFLPNSFGAYYTPTS